MNMGKLNESLTLITNVGVLLGIGLILMELNQNAELMRAQMSQARSDQLRSSYEARMHSDHWPQIITKVDSASTTREWIDSLTDVEYERVRVYYLGIVNDISNQFYLCDEGYLDERTCQENTLGQLRRSMPVLPYIYRPIADSRLTQVMQELAMTEGNLPYPLPDRTWMMPEEVALPGIFSRPRNALIKAWDNDLLVDP